MKTSKYHARERRRAAVAEATYLLANFGCKSDPVEATIAMAQDIERYVRTGKRKKAKLLALKPKAIEATQ